MVDISVVSGPESVGQIQMLLGDGSEWGLNIGYVIQPEAGGIAECFSLARDQIRNSSVALILGDNLIYGAQVPARLVQAQAVNPGATILGYPVADPSAFGVVELDADGRPLSLEEKPTQPRSRLAVPGLYFYDDQVIDIASRQRRSARGELEITDVNKAYLELGALAVVSLGRGASWLDGGTPADLFEAGQFV